MSFSASASNVRLDDGHVLRASLRNAEGNTVEAELNLDTCIGNQDGWFMWEGVNFSKSARNVRLEGSNLTAELTTASGGYRERQGINLNDRISNDNGRLIFA